MTAVISCNHWNRAIWRSPDGTCTGHFDPSGSIAFADDKKMLDPHVNPNIIPREDTSVLSVRVFVPLNNGERAWTAVDIVTAARKARDTMDGCDGWVICYQAGRHSSTNSGVKVEGEGLQIVVIGTKGGVIIRDFEDSIVKLCEILARELNYKQLVFELQENGMFKSTVGVSP